MQAKLHLIKGNPQGKQVEIPPGTLTVGRAEDSALIIASTRVSRHHCEIVNDEKRLVIRDKGSGNGTLVNGARIKEQVLNAGDQVEIGPLTFLVEIDGRRAPAAKPKPAAIPQKPAPAKPAAAPKSAKPIDALSALQRMVAKKPGGASGHQSGGVLEISDEDFLDPDKK